MIEILHEGETWVAVGFVLVIALLVWKGVPAMVGKMLDQRAAIISAELEEARRLRAEAAALLADYKTRAAGAEAEAQTIVADARAEAVRFAEESRAALKAQIARRGDKKRCGRPQHDRHSQRELGPAQQLPVLPAHIPRRSDIEGQRQHHHLHHRQAGNEQPPHGGAALPSTLVVRGCIIERGGSIAQRGDGADDGRESRLRFTPTHRQSLRRVGDRGAPYAVQLLQLLFNQPSAGRTLHRFNRQHSFAFRAAVDHPPELPVRIVESLCKSGPGRERRGHDRT